MQLAAESNTGREADIRFLPGYTLHIHEEISATLARLQQENKLPLVGDAVKGADTCGDIVGGMYSALVRDRVNRLARQSRTSSAEPLNIKRPVITDDELLLRMPPEDKSEIDLLVRIAKGTNRLPLISEAIRNAQTSEEMVQNVRGILWETR